MSGHWGFELRVPPSFYDEEDRKLASIPMPPDYEIGLMNGRCYYINHNTRETSWIDPRTSQIRKHNLDDVYIGELPYGWEEALDDEVGVYYINHLLKSNYLDPPWDPNIKEQLQDITLFLESQIQAEMEAIDRLQHEESLATERESTLRREREQLEIQLMDEGSNGSSSAPTENPLLTERRGSKEVYRKSKAVAFAINSNSITSDSDSLVVKRIRKVDEELAQNRKVIHRTPQILEESRKKVDEMITLNENLVLTQGRDEVAKTKELTLKVNEITRMLEAEAKARANLQQQVQHLRAELDVMIQREKAKNEERERKDWEEKERKGLAEKERKEREEKERKERERESELNRSLEKKYGDGRSHSLGSKRKTHYEVVMDLMELKQMVAEEKREREKLTELKVELEKTKEEIQSIGTIPDWLKQIDQAAKESKTIRMKIHQKQKKNPDQLSLKERILFFTAAAVENQPDDKS